MPGKTPEQKATHAAKERGRRAADKAWLESLPEEERIKVKAERSAKDRTRRKKFRASLSPEETARRKAETAAYDAEKYQRDKEAFALLPLEEQEAITKERQEKNKLRWIVSGDKYKQNEKERFEALSEEEKAQIRAERAAYQRDYRAQNLDRIRLNNRIRHRERGHIYAANRKAKFESLAKDEKAQLRAEAREYQQAYYYANQEAILKQKKEYYQENRELILVKKHDYYLNNKEARQAYNKAYYDKNALKLNEKSRIWYLENHEQALETARLYRQNNPEKVRACEKACDANRRGAPGKITSADVRDAIAASEGRCPYCIDELVFGQIHIDHVIPLSRGGHNTRENITACCAGCNLSKNDKTPREFVLGLRYEF